MGLGEVLNGEKAERKLWQETKIVLAGHTEGAEKRPAERPNLQWKGIRARSCSGRSKISTRF